MVDGGDRGKAEGSGWKARLLKQIKDQVFDPPWVVSPDEAEQIIEERRQSALSGP